MASRKLKNVLIAITSCRNDFHQDGLVPRVQGYNNLCQGSADLAKRIAEKCGRSSLHF